MGQIVLSVKTEKNKVGIQLTDGTNMARIRVGGDSESSPQTPAGLKPIDSEVAASE